MKERPILFSGPMVRAILEGKKTQTRRIIKPQPTGEFSGIVAVTSGFLKSEPRYVWRDEYGELAKWLRCPYGATSDRLWVRETFTEIIHGQQAIYRADGDEYGQIKWTPSIFMPRWASRLTLEVTDVRPEKLHDISESDAMEEGWPERGVGISFDSAVGWFRELWDSINAGRGYGWKENPYLWVWVVSFKKISP